MCDIMSADAMAARDAMTSAAMVLTYVSGNMNRTVQPFITPHDSVHALTQSVLIIAMPAKA